MKWLSWIYGSNEKFREVQAKELQELQKTLLKQLDSTSNTRLQTDFQKSKHLADGGFGVVIKVQHKLDKQKYAVKKIPVDSKTKEVEIHARLNHKRIVDYYSSWEDTDTDSRNYQFIQTKYCANYTLQHAIDNHLCNDPHRSSRLFVEIVEGVAYLHEKKIIHCDLKADNIFITAEDHVKIGDFGRAGYQNEQYDPKEDMFQLGIMLFDMSFPPYENDTCRREVLNSIMSSLLPIIPNHLKKYANEKNISIIEKLLSSDSKDRPSAIELLGLLGRGSELILYSNLESTDLNTNVSFKIKFKIIDLFKRYGGIEIPKPLFTRSSNNATNIAHSGINLCIPSIDQACALKFTSPIRQYSIEPYNFKNMASNSQRERSNECTFDVITHNPGDLFTTSEQLAMAYEITREIPTLKQKNIRILINHFNIVKALLLYFEVPERYYAVILEKLLEFNEKKITKSKLLKFLREIMPKESEFFYKIIQSRFTLTNEISLSIFRDMLVGEDEVAKLVKVACHEIQTILKFSQAFGVKCEFFWTIDLLPNVKSDGIVWQMLSEDEISGTHNRILAAGQCYDSILSDYAVGGVGFSFYPANLLKASTAKQQKGHETSVDVVVWRQKSKYQMSAIAIMKSLREAKITVCPIEASNIKEVYALTTSLGARVIATPLENDLVSIAVFDQLWTERNLKCNEVLAEILNDLHIRSGPNELG